MEEKEGTAVNFRISNEDDARADRIIELSRAIIAPVPEQTDGTELLGAYMLCICGCLLSSPNPISFYRKFVTELHQLLSSNINDMSEEEITRRYLQEPTK